MGEYDKAIHPLKLGPVCPGCGDAKQLERLNSLIWRCDTCSKRFEVPKPAVTES